MDDDEWSFVLRAIRPRTQQKRLNGGILFDRLGWAVAAAVVVVAFLL